MVAGLNVYIRSSETATLLSHCFWFSKNELHVNTEVKCNVVVSFCCSFRDGQCEVSALQPGEDHGMVKEKGTHWSIYELHKHISSSIVYPEAIWSWQPPGCAGFCSSPEITHRINLIIKPLISWIRSSELLLSSRFNSVNIVLVLLCTCCSRLRRQWWPSERLTSQWEKGWSPWRTSESRRSQRPRKVSHSQGLV